MLMIMLFISVYAIDQQNKTKDPCNTIFTKEKCEVTKDCQWTIPINYCLQNENDINQYKGYCEQFSFQIECANNELENQLDDILTKLEITQKYITMSKDTVLMIGNTGSGKSTLFNWISGAEFRIIFDPKSKLSYLVPIEDGQTNYSIQGSGTKSVTKIPFINFIKNHTIIDFPGFSDTDGWKQQFLYDLMLSNLMNQNQIKLIYVIDHPKEDFYKRGIDVQIFLDKFFSKHNVHNVQLLLVLNQYDGELDEQDLIKYVQQQLNEISLLDQFKQNKEIIKSMQNNIFVIPKVTINKNNYDKVFNNSRRNQFWDIIQSQQPVQIQLCQSEHFNKISEYLLKKGQQLINVMQKINKNKQMCIQNNNQQQIQQIFDEFTQLFNQLTTNNNNKLLIYYQLFSKPFDKQKCFDRFINIYQHFTNYSQEIDAYQWLEQQLQLQLYNDIEIAVQQIYSQYKTIKRDYEKKIDELELQIKINAQQYHTMLEEKKRQILELKEKLREKSEAQQNRGIFNTIGDLFHLIISILLFPLKILF